MAFYNRDNVFTRAKQAKKRIHIDFKQDDQAADILSAPHIPHREAESEKALNHTPKHEALFDTDDPIHCKRKRGEDTTVKPADDSSEDLKNSLPTSSHQEEYLEPKIETVIESTVETIRPFNDNFEVRVQFNQENVFTKITQAMKRKEDDSKQDIQLLQQNADTATSTELHLRASVIGKNSEDIQSNVLRAGSSTEKRVEGIAHRPAEDSVQETLPTRINPNSRLHPPDSEVHSTTRTTYGSGPSLYTERMDTSKTVDSLKPEIENVDYFIRTTKSKCQDPTDMIDFESDSSLQPQNTTPTLNNAETQLQIRNSNVFGEETNTTMSSGNTKANRVLYNRDNVFTKAKQQKRRNQSNLEGQDQIHHRIAEVPTGSGMHFDAVDNEFKHTTYLEGQYGINGRSSMTQHAREVDDSANTVGSRLTSSSVLTKDPVVVKVPNDMSSPSNTANIMNATTSSGNTSVNRVLYNRDNVFTRAKQEKRRNQRNLEEKPQIHHQTADIPTGSGLHLDAVDNEFMHTSYLGVQPDISSIKKQKMEVDDSVNSIDPRLNISSVVPTDAVFDKVQNETGLSFETGSIMNATTSSGNTSVNRVLYNRDNVFTRAKQEKRRNQRNLEEKPEIHHQTADIPTGSGLHLDAVDNEFMHTSYLGVQPDISSMKKQKMEVDDSVNSIDSRLNLSSVVPRDAVFDKVQNETDLSFKTGSIMNATTSSGNTSANRVLYNRDNVFTRAKQEKRRNQMNLEERPQIHYQTADIPTGSGLHLDAVDNEFMHTSYLGVQPDISSMKEQKMEVDDSVNSIDPRLNLSSVVPTDAVFDKAQNETGLSFKTGSIMNATTSSGNTSVNRVLYNRDNVFTRAKQEKRRNQRNLEERPQIHHQTADIPTGSGLHLDAVDNEYMHTSYLGVQSDISSMKKQKMEVDDSVNSIDPRLNLSSVVPTDAVFDKVQNETGLSCKTGSIILKQITVGCEGHYREAENCSQHESFEQANLENSPNCDDWSLISLSNV
ncbi:uncharacterized protein LOC109410295 isoform X6 [Aedes albopictus]|uniref:Uncharacterized protein n=1 Tax=Aedes albopictus TaxID=7160 RepID=A0ABM1Z2U5_AEDAL